MQSGQHACVSPLWDPEQRIQLSHAYISDLQELEDDKSMFPPATKTVVICYTKMENKHNDQPLTNVNHLYKHRETLPVKFKIQFQTF